MEEELRKLMDEHFNKGNLQYFEIEKYTADVQKEVNMMTVEDTMSIRPPVRQVPQERENPMENPKDLFCCKYCDKVFPLPSEFHDHLKKCEKRKEKKEEFRCSICGNSFVMDTTRDFHEYKVCLKMEGEPQFSCRVCSEKFFLEENRNIHERDIHKIITEKMKEWENREKKEREKKEKEKEKEERGEEREKRKERRKRREKKEDTGEEERSFPAEECGFCGEKFFV